VRVADIGGGRDDDFRYETTTVPASAFRHVLGTDPRVSEYQVTQTADGADIVVVGTPDADALTASVIAALRSHRLPDPKVAIRAVESLKRHQTSGKLRRFIPLDQ
jgi:phenylacetate-CoA ligase